MSGKFSEKLHPSWMIIAWAVGIIIGSIFEAITKFAGFLAETWLVISIFGLIISIIFNYKPSLLLAFLSGVILVGKCAAPKIVATSQLKGLYGNEFTLKGKILNDLDVSESKISFVVGITDIIMSDNKSPPKIRGTPAIYITTSAKLSTAEMPRRSDIITLRGKVDTGFGNYAGSMFRPEILEVTRPTPGDFFLEIRDGFAEKIRNYLVEPEAGLALGYLLGVKSEVDENFYATLQVVGLTHIIVASGTQLSILAEVAKKLFGKFSRFAGMTGAILLIVSFTGMVGLSPSMLRAGIVAIMSLVAWYFGREQKTWRMLLLVAAGTLVYDPENLTDLGWQLSFGSFFGLLVLGPKMTRFFYGEHKPGFFGEAIFSSLAAGATVTPILLYSFGDVSLISVIANLLILPTISPVMGLTFVIGVGSMLLGENNLIVSLLSNLTTFILDYHIGTINLLGSFEFFLVKIPENNLLVFLLYLPVILIIFPYKKFFKKKPEILPEELIFIEEDIEISSNDAD